MQDETLNLEQLVEAARTGQQAALEELVRAVQPRVYNLALRMVWHPADAEDATQEILIKVITHLGQFRQESAFLTWVYRIATNHLLTMRERQARTQELNFDTLLGSLEKPTAQSEQNLPDRNLLEQELRLRCTLGMLLCLDRPHRAAFVLGEIFEVSSQEAAFILEITPQAYRKRLSRARERLQSFMQAKCGLVNPARQCQCVAKFNFDSDQEKQRLAALFTTNPLGTTILQPDKGLLNHVTELKELDRVSAVYRTQPLFADSDQFLTGLKDLLSSGKYKVLEV